MDISITAKSIEVNGESHSKVTVELKGVEKSAIIEKFTYKEIVAHFDNEALLNAIGVDKAMEHFELICRE